MTNVSRIHGGDLTDGPVADVVDLLEDMLDAARAGHIKAVGVAACYRDGGIFADFRSDETGPPLLLSAAGMLNYRIAYAMDTT